MRRLSDHFAAGRLSVAEFDERSARVAAAMTRGELVPLFADLPEPVAAQPAAAAPEHRGRKQEIGGSVMGLVVIAALVLFFITHIWLWFLMIPAAGILFGAVGQGGRGRDRRDRRNDRRDRRRGR